MVVFTVSNFQKMRRETPHNQLSHFHCLVRKLAQSLGITKLRQLPFAAKTRSKIWNGPEIPSDGIVRDLVAHFKNLISELADLNRRNKLVALADEILAAKDNRNILATENFSLPIDLTHGHEVNGLGSISSNLAADGASVPETFTAPGFISKLRCLKKKQLSEARRLVDIGAQRDCLHLLAVLAKDREDWQDAINMIQQSVGLSHRIHDRVSEGTLLNDLAWAQYRGYQWEAALSNLKQAELHWKELDYPDKRQLSRTLDYQAINLRVLAKYLNVFEHLDVAEKLLRKSLEIRQKLKSPLGIATTRHRLGRVLSHQAHWWLKHYNARKLDAACSSAAECFEEARKHRLQHGHHLDYARTTILYARHLATVDACENKQLIEEMLNDATKVSLTHNIRETLVQSSINKARFERKIGNVPEAKKNLTKLLSEYKLSISDRAQVYEECAKLAGVVSDKKQHDKLWNDAASLWRKLRNDKGADSAASRSNSL